MSRSQYVFLAASSGLGDGVVVGAQIGEGVKDWQRVSPCGKYRNVLVNIIKLENPSGLLDIILYA